MNGGIHFREEEPAGREPVNITGKSRHVDPDIKRLFGNFPAHAANIIQEG
jgi:hypothetical protein